MRHPVVTQLQQRRQASIIALAQNRHRIALLLGLGAGQGEIRERFAACRATQRLAGLVALAIGALGLTDGGPVRRRGLLHNAGFLLLRDKRAYFKSSINGEISGASAGGIG